MASDARQRFLERYNTIKDTFKTIEEVIHALENAGLEQTNLIVGVDFTASNSWNGKRSFGGRSLHAVDFSPHPSLNPYELALSIIGRTLEPFDKDRQIPCFGFGDASTTDTFVFDFNSNGVPCNGFEEALRRYREIAPKVKLAGPTSFAPIIEAAVRIVEESVGQHHFLLIIADGEMTKPSDTPPGKQSRQEEATIEAIVAASNYPLSIVVVGVGDGPWDTMLTFDNNLPQRVFDNFQFVEFSKVMDRKISDNEKECLFAMNTLMEVPFQFQALKEAGILGHKIGRMPPRGPKPPPPEVS